MKILELSKSDKFLLEEILIAVNEYSDKKLSLGGLVKRLEECGENIVDDVIKKTILDCWWKIEIAYASFLEKATVLEQDQRVIEESLDNIKELAHGYVAPTEDPYAWPYNE